MHARTCPPKNQGDRTSRPSLWGEPTFLWNLPDGKRKKNTPLARAGKRQDLGRGAAPSKPPPALWKVHKNPKKDKNTKIRDVMYRLMY